MNAQKLREILFEMKGDSSEWPSDEAFSKAWMDANAYSTLNNLKLVHIFKRLNQRTLTGKQEKIEITGDLSIEHLLPQNWIEHWLLADGTKGMDWNEQQDADRDDPRYTGSKRRDAALQTMGNLTILTQPLNSSVSNSAWSVKRPALLNSLLPINVMLATVEKWDEGAIERRGKALLAHALQIWPR